MQWYSVGRCAGNCRNTEDLPIRRWPSSNMGGRWTEFKAERTKLKIFSRPKNPCPAESLIALPTTNGFRAVEPILPRPDGLPSYQRGTSSGKASSRPTNDSFPLDHFCFSACLQVVRHQTQRQRTVFGRDGVSDFAHGPFAIHEVHDLIGVQFGLVLHIE